ncbi:MAG: DJ-1/PfpI family protein, partial [Clostridiales bacterium]|nr:DJ-1/PfpI family protein [Clostridiales bacterium]
MKKIAVLVTDGVEEVECLTVVDFCRRAGIEVTTVSVTGKNQVTGSHNIMFHTDRLYGDVDFSAFDGIVFPGGPGTGALGAAEGVRALAEEFLKGGKLLAAICAAPGMLSESG